MRKSRDLSGQKIGKLRVLNRAPSQIQSNGRTRTMWLCVCECGREREIVSDSLTKKQPTQSCGCIQNTGRRSHALYRRWVQMIQRCENPNSVDYSGYGGKGISVCESWRSDFYEFLKDMGECPAGMSLDRIDTLGNYEPSNCRWATAKEQSRNRRNSVLVELGGKVMSTAEASGAIGCGLSSVMKWARSSRNIDAAAENYRTNCAKGGS